MYSFRSFKKDYFQLQDSESRSNAILSINENIPVSLDFFYHELKNETDLNTKEFLSKIFNSIISDKYAFVLQSLHRKDFVTLETLFGLTSAYVFKKHPFEHMIQLDIFSDQLIKRLNKEVLESANAESIINEMNTKITQSLIIDNSFLGHYDFSEVSTQHIVSQFTLAIIFLIIAEKLQLPIFGLPFEDKLVLCYAENYCIHNELVDEKDLLFYVIIGERDIVYTLEDLKLLALIQEETIHSDMILPKSSQKIMEAWLAHLNQKNFDVKTKSYLSSIYQQIFSFAEEF